MYLKETLTLLKPFGYFQKSIYLLHQIMQWQFDGKFIKNPIHQFDVLSGKMMYVIWAKV